ncbi:MAG TPA: OmpA family protein, partial [Candidatus Acidoferrales bacterium]
LADALFPVMGPAIRKSITETLRSMLETFNAALENSLSARGLQWRVESFRSGRPFAEIVLMHSLLFRVEQVFLIHRQTGLVLNHAVAPAVATQDPAMVAGMLSAIQQFVQDSFQTSSGDTLGSMDVGELQVWVEDGPHAVIAAVIRGHAPSDYRLALKQALESIERGHAAALDQFQGDAGSFRSTGDALHRLLETQYREKEAGRRTPRAAIVAGGIVLALLIAWAAFFAYGQLEWSRYLRALRGQPGIVIVSYSKEGGRLQIRGFRDPLSADPAALFSQAQLNPARADLQLVPFYSLDDALVARRAEEMLAPPPGVHLAEKGGVLSVSGLAPTEWIAQFEERARLIPGVNSMDDSQLQDTGVRAIESAVVTFPLGSSTLAADQQSALAGIAVQIREVLDRTRASGRSASIELIGHTDSTGVEGTNLLLSQQRADRILQFLSRAGIPSASLISRGVGVSQPLRQEDSEEGRRLNRSVTFHVAFSPAPPAN